ncbi:MAG: glycosyltransferase involved in cell wall biosynthesis [Bacteriovoracaceae bacterium]
MKIVFHSSVPLPVKTYGGIERIVFWHMRELARLGHDVVLIGHPDSEVSKYGIELIPYAKADLNWENLIPQDAEVAHLPYNHQVRTGLPTISTVHGNGQIGEVLNKNSVFVSKRHAEIHGGEVFIHNALDFNEYPFDDKKKLNWDRFVFLAKASWRVKNLKHCIRACRSGKKNLDIIGGKSLIPWPRIHSHGILGGEKKLEILNKADALLFPVRWEEPFGIAIIEAMSLGLPVIGSKYGSLKELISDEVGVTCDSYEEFSSLIKNGPARSFDPIAIRSNVESRFSIMDHTKKYLELYEKVSKGEELHGSNLGFKGKLRAETLLPF